jgi:hypothetical protein
MPVSSKNIIEIDGAKYDLKNCAENYSNYTILALLFQCHNKNFRPDRIFVSDKIWDYILENIQRNKYIQFNGPSAIFYGIDILKKSEVPDGYLLAIRKNSYTVFKTYTSDQIKAIKLLEE